MSKFVDFFTLALFSVLLVILEWREKSTIIVFVFLALFMLLIFSIIFRFFLVKILKVRKRASDKKNRLIIFPLIVAIFCGKKVAAQLGYDNYLILMSFVVLFSIIFSMAAIIFVKDFLQEGRSASPLIDE